MAYRAWQAPLQPLNTRNTRGVSLGGAMVMCVVYGEGMTVYDVMSS